ncbi:cell wall-binding protein [Lachnospiraceae bacterium 62-35]
MRYKGLKHILVPCAAAVFSLGASVTSYAATGWRMEDGNWYYYTSDGTRATETWKKSGNYWFWLDSNGEMATESLIEDGDDYYYVNGDGAMVKNGWRKTENPDSNDSENEESWYYFDNTGKAYKAPDSGRTSFKNIKKADGSTKKYAFDSEGRMLYGWVNEESERLTDEEAWKEGIYYLGEEDDGAQRSFQWERLEVEDDDNEKDDFDGTYWFYFGSNGKKISDGTKKINGRKYRFEENGNAVFNWYLKASSSTASPSDFYYNSPEQCWQAEGWFKSVPDEELDKEGYDNGDEYWFYAQKSGELVKSQIKKINGYDYGFNEKGEMLHGLYKLTFDGKEIISSDEIESQDDLPDGEDDCEVYYFGDSPKEGAAKLGITTIKLDGESYTYHFQKTGSGRARGYNGIHDGSIYVKGRLLKADKDYKMEIVTWGDQEYLVNTSGKIQKNKKNVKDADGIYYCTDNKGIVTYRGDEKWTKEDE